MRTLATTSRALAAGAALVAALLVLGGAYFVGYVSELQRSLSDPKSQGQIAASQIGSIERALGYAGFLRTYRNYRLTGDASNKPLLNRQAALASGAIKGLKELYVASPAALDAIAEASTIVDTFAHVAQTAPETGAGLRGSASMDALNTLPQSTQLETAYLSLTAALSRLQSADMNHQMGGVAYALSWSQTLIVAAVAALIIGLITVAALLQLGIIQPLKSLERSLTSVGDGAVSHAVWGMDRKDEIGALARAGEKLRRTLTETTALRTLADKGQLHVTFEGQSSVLFDKLASGVTTAADALKAATADLAKTQEEQQRQLDSVLQKLGQSGASFDETAKALNAKASTAIADVHASATSVFKAADERTQRLDKIAGQFEQGGKSVEEAVATMKQRTIAAAVDITDATTALKRLSQGAELIQNAFFASCDKISSDAANTTEKVRTLAGRLSETIGNVDERLSSKLASLDNLEQGLLAALDKLQTSAEKTVATAQERSQTIDRKVSDFEDIVRIFRDDKLALHQSSSHALNEIRATQRDLANTAKAQAAENQELAGAIAKLDQLAQRMSGTAAQDLDTTALKEALQEQLETVRAEIRDLAVRMTEERILSTADLPVGAPGTAAFNLEPQSPHRTLADVPGNEVLARLKDLAAEMNAAQSRYDQTASLKAALGTFAGEVKDLAANADRTARLKAMGKALDRYADEIESHATVVEPSATALRTELHAITSELRTVAARAQASNAKDGPRLREGAMELGARAESLFTYLSETHHAIGAPDDHGEPTQEEIDAASADIAALAELISRLEARAEHLSQTAVAARFAEIRDDLSPAEREAAIRNTALKTDGAIHTVFESIERLNNIAAALARAGDADRQRHAAH